MEKLQSYENIVELGKKITAELKLGPSVDTLGKWMAYYIAELIEKAEQASGAEAERLKKECAETILNLWRHHAVYPNGKDPFNKILSLAEWAEGLNCRNETPIYRPKLRERLEGVNLGADAEKWLNAANVIDDAALLLVKVCLTQAASEAITETTELAELVASIDAADQVVIRFISSIAQDHDFNEKRLIDEQRDDLKRQIEKLESFKNLADKLRTVIADKLSLLK